jgi:CIC family chloride channel protein
MASCIIATLVTTRLKRDSIYTLKLLRRGVDIFGGRELNVLKSLRVGQVMSRDMVTVPAGEPLGRLLEKVTRGPLAYLYVEDREGRLQGVIGLPEMRDALLEADVLSDLLVAGELAREDVPTVTPGQDLDTVMRIFGGKDREELPVVEPGRGRRLLGVITRRHLIDSYNRELMKRDMVAGLGGGLAATATDEVLLGGEYRMVELDAPGEFMGRTIRALAVRARYGVQVLLIRRPSPSGTGDGLELVPGPDTVVQRGDRLVVMGLESDLDRLRAL